MCTFETNEIYLTWRKAVGNRRYIIGKLIKDNDKYSFQYLSASGLEKAKAVGFEHYPAFPKLDKIYDEEVLTTFSRRLVNPARSDYEKFLKYWCAENFKNNNFALLGLTGAKLQTDTFEFIAPHYETPAAFYTEVAGLHHADENLLNEIKATENFEDISLKPEPENQYDPDAVKVLYKGFELGYIKIVHSTCIAKAFKAHRNISAKIKNIIKNGSLKEILLDVKID